MQASFWPQVTVAESLIRDLGRVSRIKEKKRIVALKLLELTRFASPNQSIYFDFVRCWGSVVMLTFQTNRQCADH